MKKIKVNDEIIGKWYGKVLPLGKKDDEDSSIINDPYVIYDGNIYHMWYSGYDGKHVRIFYATSKDGKRWIKHGIVINAGADYKNEVYNACSPSVIYDGSIFHMWYTGHSGTIRKIHYATSDNGLNWTKHGITVPLGNKGESDCSGTQSPSVIYHDNLYHMWYAGYDDIHKRIHYATSIDGKAWIKHGVVLPLGNEGESDCYHTSNPSVIYDNGIFKMWYNGFNCKVEKILYAESEDGKNWTKYGLAKPLLPNIYDDNYHIDTPCVINDEDVYKMWFNGYVDSDWRIHYTELLKSSIKTKKRSKINSTIYIL